ncbi:MAG: histone deacetylase [Aestuariibacter sp.]
MLPFIFHPIYSQLTLPGRHRFPIEKYQGIQSALIENGVPTDWFLQPDPVSKDILCRYFSPSYVDAFCDGVLDAKAMRRIGFPWSQQLVKRSLTAVGGTLLTAQQALHHNIAINLTGGYHHAFADLGAGFCIFNDLYLAARQMIEEPGIERVLIIDCDVHQGDGTALLAENDTQIFTLSLHGEKNFPVRKQVSNMDVPLQKGCQDEEYLDVLDTSLFYAFAQAQPDAVIYDAGVDVHEDDDLGHLSLTTEGVFKRDVMVLQQCMTRQLPVMAVIGGGYQRDINALVSVHLQLFRAAFSVFRGQDLTL